VSGLPQPLAYWLLLSYTSHGDSMIASKVFDAIPVKNGITWVTMVSPESDHASFHAKAVKLFTCICHK
jgi:hypothetical protein